MTTRIKSQEILKCLGKLFVNNSDLQSYVGLRIYREGSINYRENITPYITIEIDFASTITGLPSDEGNIRLSVWNCVKNSENKRTSEEIAAIINSLINGDEGKDNINDTGDTYGFMPKIRYINRMNAFFMPVEQDGVTRYVQNYNVIVGNQ